MTTRERISSELEHVPEDRLDALYEVVKQFATNGERKPGLLSKLKQIKIEAPEDFAANLDQYAVGPLRVERDH